jgi:hypothetical protein
LRDVVERQLARNLSFSSSSEPLPRTFVAGPDVLLFVRQIPFLIWGERGLCVLADPAPEFHIASVVGIPKLWISPLIESRSLTRSETLKSAGAADASRRTSDAPSQWCTSQKLGSETRNFSPVSLAFVRWYSLTS